MRVIHNCTDKPKVTEELDRLAFFHKGEAIAWWNCPVCGTTWELSMLSYLTVWRVKHRKMHHEKNPEPRIPRACPTDPNGETEKEPLWSDLIIYGGFLLIFITLGVAIIMEILN